MDANPAPVSRSYSPAQVGTTLIAGYPGPAALTDGDGIVVTANAAAAGYLRPGLPWHAGSRVLAGREGVPESGALSEYGRDGDRLVIRWAAVPLPDAPPPGEDTGGAASHALFGIDVTLDANMRTALAESRQRFRDLAALAGDIAWETDHTGRLVYLTLAPRFGYRSNRLIGRPAAALLAMELADLNPFTAQRPVRDLPIWLTCADGQHLLVAMSADPIFDPHGTWVGARGLGTDITERQSREASLAEVHERDRLIGLMAAAMHQARNPDAALSGALAVLSRAISTDGATAYTIRPDHSPRPLIQVGATAPDHLEAVLEEILGEVLSSGTDQFADYQGTRIAAMLCGSDTMGRGVVMGWREAGAADFAGADHALMNAARPQLSYAISHVMEGRRLRQQAERDGLTGLLNRVTLTRRVSERLARADRSLGALLYIDLDNFKALNDTRGHGQGDDALRRVSAIFRAVVRPGDLAGRIGGDEFVLWLEDRTAAGVRDVAEDLVSRGRDLGDLSASPDRPLGLSVGVALAPHTRRETAAALIDRADRAMYRAKGAAKQRQSRGGWGMADGDPSI